MARDKSDQDEHDPTLGPKVSAVHVGGDSLLERLVPHMKQIGIGLVAVAVLLTGFFTWRWWKHRAAEKSTDRLALALDVADTPVMPEEGPLPSDKMGDHFKTHAERAEKTLAALAKVGEVRSTAALYEAQLLVEAGKLDQALAAYKKLGAKAGLDGAVAREGVGVVLEAQAAAAKDPAQHHKLMEDALAAFRAVQPDDKGPRRDYSLYHEARLLEALGKPTDAVAQLKKALEVAPSTPLRGMIEMRLSALGVSTGEGS